MLREIGNLLTHVLREVDSSPLTHVLREQVSNPLAHILRETTPSLN